MSLATTITIGIGMPNFLNTVRQHRALFSLCKFFGAASFLISRWTQNRARASVAMKKYMVVWVATFFVVIFVSLYLMMESVSTNMGKSQELDAVSVGGGGLAGDLRGTAVD